jgi:hypothetical protein
VLKQASQLGWKQTAKDVAHRVKTLATGSNIEGLKESVKHNTELAKGHTRFFPLEDSKKRLLHERLKVHGARAGAAVAAGGGAYAATKKKKTAGLQKQAGPRIDKAIDWLKKRPEAYGRAKKHLKEVGSMGFRDEVEGQRVGMPSMMHRVRNLGHAAKEVAPELGTAAGLTAAGVAAHKLRKKKHASASDIDQIRKIARVIGVMNKMAEDMSPDVSASGEGVPALPAEAAKQENLINSLQAAMDYTKREAKDVPKERMGEVLDEPAQEKTLDSVLQNNLSNTGEAGVKISSAEAALAARTLLQKIAEEGARADASSEDKERASRLAEILDAKGKEKASQGLGMGMANPAAGSMPLGGGF